MDHLRRRDRRKQRIHLSADDPRLQQPPRRRFDRITSQSSRFTAEEINDAMNIVAMDFHEHFDGCTLRSLTYDEAFNTEQLAASGQDPQRTIILMSVFDVCEAGNAAKTLNNGSTYVDYPWVLSQDGAGRWHISGGGYG